MKKTLKTDARRPAVILALCVLVLVALAVLAGTGSAKTPTKAPDSEGVTNCLTEGNRVCGALKNGKPATGKALLDAQSTARENLTQGCHLTNPRYWGPDNTVPYGFKQDCAQPAVPVKVAPKVTG